MAIASCTLLITPYGLIPLNGDVMKEAYMLLIMQHEQKKGAMLPCSHCALRH